MKITKETLQQTYYTLKTDELLQLFHSDEITDIARTALTEELLSRRIDVPHSPVSPGDADNEEEVPAHSLRDLSQHPERHCLTPFTPCGGALDETTATIMQGRLAAENIPSFLMKDDCGGMRPHLQTTGGIMLHVPVEDVAQARRLLDAPVASADHEIPKIAERVF